MRRVDDVVDGEADDEREGECLDDAERHREEPHQAEHRRDHPEEAEERGVRDGERAREDEHRRHREERRPEQRRVDAAEEGVLGGEHVPLGAARDAARRDALEAPEPALPLLLVVREQLRVGEQPQRRRPARVELCADADAQPAHRREVWAGEAHHLAVLRRGREEAVHLRRKLAGLEREGGLGLGPALVFEQPLLEVAHHAVRPLDRVRRVWVVARPRLVQLGAGFDERRLVLPEHRPARPSAQRVARLRLPRLDQLDAPEDVAHLGRCEEGGGHLLAGGHRLEPDNHSRGDAQARPDARAEQGEQQQEQRAARPVLLRGRLVVRDAEARLARVPRQRGGGGGQPGEGGEPGAAHEEDERGGHQRRVRQRHGAGQEARPHEAAADAGGHAVREQDGAPPHARRVGLAAPPDDDPRGEQQVRERRRDEEGHRERVGGRLPVARLRQRLEEREPTARGRQRRGGLRRPGGVRGDAGRLEGAERDAVAHRVRGGGKGDGVHVERQLDRDRRQARPARDAARDLGVGRAAQHGEAHGEGGAGEGDQQVREGLAVRGRRDERPEAQRRALRRLRHRGGGEEHGVGASEQRELQRVPVEAAASKLRVVRDASEDEGDERARVARGDDAEDADELHGVAERAGRRPRLARPRRKDAEVYVRLHRLGELEQRHARHQQRGRE